MSRIHLKSYAKINLSLDVGELMDSGYHRVEMVLQQIHLSDEIDMEWHEVSDMEEILISLKTNKAFLPTDEQNLAYKAVLETRKYCDRNKVAVPAGEIHINIKKKIPIGAGMAGGSGNGAAVIHGLNILWDLNLDLAALCEIGETLGSDVPFCIMGQAAMGKRMRERFGDDPLACHCALATGRGTELRPLKGINRYLVISKPPFGVSTAKAYRGIDEVAIHDRPDNEAMTAALEKGVLADVEKNMVNVLENYVLREYPKIVYTKNKMQELCGNHTVIMSGSGPTVYCFCDDMEQAKTIAGKMKEINRESYWTRTTC